MKKTALSLSLLLALLAGTMVGCDVKSKKVDGKEVIFSVGDHNFTAEELLGFTEASDVNFLDTDEGVQAAYEAVYKAVAQANVAITSTIDAAVAEKMDEWDEEVSSYASSNGVTTRDAKETLLEQYGFETEDELKASYYVEEQKDELASMYKNANKEPEVSAIAENGNTMLERYVKNTAPMVVKHVLVKVADSTGLNKSAQITESEVDKLVDVFQRFALGKEKNNSFKQIAIDRSEDSTNTKGGNLGILDTYSSYVSEFKLGLYASEISLHKDDYKGESHTYDKNDVLVSKDAKDDLFGDDGIYADYELKSINVAALASVLNYVKEDVAKDVQKAAGNDKKADYDSTLYPRNVLFNHYLNTPVAKRLVVDMDNVEADMTKMLKLAYNTSDVSAKVTAIKNTEFFKNFSENTANFNIDANKYILDGTDATAKPLTFVKSQYGFHFMSVTYSSLDKDFAEAVKYFMYDTTKAASLSGTYVKNTDFDLGYSSTTVGKNNRRTEIENRVLNYVKGGFESVSTSEELYEYEIFNYYFAKANSEYDLTIPNDKISSEISNFIKSQQEYKVMKIEEAQANTWSSYVKKIESNLEMFNLIYAK